MPIPATVAHRNRAAIPPSIALSLPSPTTIALPLCHLVSPLDAPPPLNVPAGCNMGWLLSLHLSVHHCLSTCRLVVTSPLDVSPSCLPQLIVASPHRRHRLSRRQLIVTLPLDASPSCLPQLVVVSPHRRHRFSMCRLVVTLPLIAPPSCLSRLVVASPLVATPALNALAGCTLPLIVPPSRFDLAGCCTTPCRHPRHPSQMC